MNRQDLALRFESLGGGSLRRGGFGCEFGFFQRDCGAEPIGLLRWASINPDNLIAALETRFRGITDPANLRLERAHGWPEWKVTNVTYRVKFDHSGLNPDAVSEDEARSIVCRRLDFLARKLIVDLESGEKTFVYRVEDGVMDRVEALAAAINAYGRNALLYVQIGSSFGVDRVHPGLMVGRIDRFAPHPETGQVKFNHGGWERVCRAAISRLSADHVPS
jgi:hypothetical protein